MVQLWHILFVPVLRKYNKCCMKYHAVLKHVITWSRCILQQLANGYWPLIWYTYILNQLMPTTKLDSYSINIYIVMKICIAWKMENMWYSNTILKFHQLFLILDGPDPARIVLIVALGALLSVYHMPIKVNRVFLSGTNILKIHWCSQWTMNMTATNHSDFIYMMHALDTHF